MHIPSSSLTDSALEASDHTLAVVLVAGANNVRGDGERARRDVSSLHLLRVVDVRVVVVTVSIRSQRVRELLHPCHDGRVNVVVDGPLKPLVAVGLLDDNLDNSVPCVGFEVVAYAISKQVACQEDNGTAVILRYPFVDEQVTQTGGRHLQQRMQHVLDRLSALGELVEHDDNRLAFMQSEPCVRVVARNLVLVVDNRHGDVAKVHVRHVHVGCVMSTRESAGNSGEHRTLANARFTPH